MVSFFAADSKEILIARKTASKSNEIPLVQEMMEEFPLQDLVITLDALHCQSKTLKAIKDSSNDYVVQVKENHEVPLEGEKTLRADNLELKFIRCHRL